MSNQKSAGGMEEVFVRTLRGFVISALLWMHLFLTLLSQFPPAEETPVEYEAGLFLYGVYFYSLQAPCDCTFTVRLLKIKIFAVMP